MIFCVPQTQSSSSTTPILFFTLRLQAHISFLLFSNSQIAESVQKSEEASIVPIYALHYTLTATKKGKNRFSLYKVIAQRMTCRVINCKCLTVIRPFVACMMPYPSHFKCRLYIRKNSQWNPESRHSSSSGWLMLFTEKNKVILSCESLR